MSYLKGKLWGSTKNLPNVPTNVIAMLGPLQLLPEHDSLCVCWTAVPSSLCKNLHAISHRLTAQRVVKAEAAKGKWMEKAKRNNEMGHNGFGGV